MEYKILFVNKEQIAGLTLYTADNIDEALQFFRKDYGNAFVL